MGSGRFDARAYASYSATTNSAKPTMDELFTARGLDPYLDPTKFGMRESRDSAANPKSTPVIVGLDVTGSMGRLADIIARQGLGVLVQGIYDRKPISDPHIMIAGIGDVECDRAPIQVSQFEAEVQPITTQIEKLFLEHGGGGNSYESYSLLHLFAATRTVSDSWEKRKKKGYLFTVGDEEPTHILRVADAARFLGANGSAHEPAAEAYTASQLLELASRTYEVFHIMVEQGSHFHKYPDKTRSAWVELMGQRAIPLADHTKLAEVILGTIQMNEGTAIEKVVESWSGETADVVHRALTRRDNKPAGARF